MNNSNRAALVKKIAALASQDPGLFHGLYEALGQYVENTGIHFEEMDPHYDGVPTEDEAAALDGAAAALEAFDLALVEAAGC